jgi:hypothetical protein
MEDSNDPPLVVLQVRLTSVHGVFIMRGKNMSSFFLVTNQQRIG